MGRTGTRAAASRIICRVQTDRHTDRPADRDDQTAEAYRLLARAQADADAIRRDALVTAEGIRQIAMEEANELAGAPVIVPSVPAELAQLTARIERLARKIKRQGRRMERLENVLLGMAPGLRKKR
jgi:hypothetical protein